MIESMAIVAAWATKAVVLVALLYVIGRLVDWAFEKR